MRILWINNHGGGFSDYIEIEPNTNVEKFIRQQLHDCDPSAFLIRVNRLPVARDYVLQEGDRITATPTKIEGAQAA